MIPKRPRARSGIDAPPVPVLGADAADDAVADASSGPRVDPAPRRWQWSRAIKAGPTPMNLFADIRALVTRSLDALAAEGALPQGLDLANVAVEPPRDPAHGDMATNAAMVLAKPAGLKPREIADLLAPRLEADARVDRAEIAGPGFLNLRLERLRLAGGGRRRPLAGRGIRPLRRGRGAEDQRRIRLRQPHRAAPCGPHPRRGLRRRARLAAGLHRPRGHPRILHQRRRRAGRRARPLRL